ncbi:acetamidase [Erysipelotrichaceae bacterium]|nr:acetamidase [Erysipelotrichaceae bacterium]
MKRVEKQNHIYAMSAKNEAVLRVESGERVLFETCDCFTDQIKLATDTFESLDWDRINPATGPIYIVGAEVGDILAIDIEKITIAARGVVATGDGLGVLGEFFPENHITFAEIDEEFVYFEDLKIPLNKMVGVIGTAPAGAEISCGTPADHGGNMDTKIITEGTRLYLPVHIAGGLLAMGDLHACMGDGEVGVSGLEVSGEVIVRVEVLKGSTIPTPAVENLEIFSTIASHADINIAITMATKAMADYIVAQTGRSLASATQLLSLAGNLRIGQVVDPNKTVRMEIAREFLATKGMR